MRTPSADPLTVYGGTPLHGEIRVRGAKNLVTKAMVAALLGDAPSRLYDVPRIRDVEVVRDLLALHGVRVYEEVGALVLDPANVERAAVDEINVHAGSSRIPILFCGPLLHRLGQAVIPDLGGCHIGPRPIDFHLQALRQFGAVVETGPGCLSAPTGCRAPGVPALPVSDTERYYCYRVKARGVTELSNAAVEPEIIDLICVLQKMGAIITVHTDRVIEIEGVERLGGFNHRPIPDRIEAASWAAAALATGGDITVRGARQVDMMTFLNVFRSVGGSYEVDDSTDGGIRFWHPGGELRATALETGVHPGFMTDWQQPMVVALTQARGLSILHETVYEQRLGYTRALNQMGATIQVYRNCLGGTPCRFGDATSPTRRDRRSQQVDGRASDIPDLRAGFSPDRRAPPTASHVYGVDLIHGVRGLRGKLRAGRAPEGVSHVGLSTCR